MVDEIHAEWVGNVMTDAVSEEHSVRDGDSVVLLESMNKEIPVLIAAKGTAGTLAVSVGDAVQQGDRITVVQ